MSESVTQNETLDSLPLIAKKKVPTILYVMGAFFGLVVLANLMLHTGSKAESDQKSEESFDTYNLKSEPSVNTSINNQSTSTDIENGLSDQASLEEAKAKDFVARLQASQSVSAGSGPTSSSAASQAGSSSPSAMSSDPNAAYVQQAAQATVDRVYATPLAPQPYLIGQGKFIFATLSTAINSDLPGQVSAIVNQDVYGEQGRNVLIPRGSRLVGEYRSMLSQNQSRLLVVWTRVIQPNGISVMIASQGTDALGQAGMTGDVDYHFAARFGAATLISMIGAGASTIGVNPDDPYNSMAAYRQAITQATSQQASAMLSESTSIPPTVHVHQGDRVVVFVNHDLDFSKVYR